MNIFLGDLLRTTSCGGRMLYKSSLRSEVFGIAYANLPFLASVKLEYFDGLIITSFSEMISEAFIKEIKAVVSLSPPSIVSEHVLVFNKSLKQISEFKVYQHVNIYF